MDFELRPIIPDEFLAFSRSAVAGFGEHAKDEELEEERPLFNFERSIAAFDGDRIVGTGETFTFQLTVPGHRQIPAGGVSWITVQPTHRRRGILNSMMTRILDDVQEREEAVAILWASESIIYGRYGYGTATTEMRFTLDSAAAKFAFSPQHGGQVEMFTREEAAAILPAIYEKARLLQPGAITRSDAYWDYSLQRDPERWWDGAGPRFFAVYRNDKGKMDGYIAYRIKNEWTNGVPNGELRVMELVSCTPSARAALWAFVLQIDLIHHIDARCPVDEPLRWMLADSRRLRVIRYHDGLWVRPMDICATLRGRNYASEGRLVLEVHDRFRPDNNGSYELEASADGAGCRRTTKEPDLQLEVADLGASYLGGTSFSSLARAGRVHECTAGALARAELLFAGERAPSCQTDF